MKIISITASAVSLVLFCSCASTPSLDQELAGKSASERQEILAKACHSEAGRGGGFSKSSAFGPHVQRMHEICNHMIQEFHASQPSSHGE